MTALLISADFRPDPAVPPETMDQHTLQLFTRQLAHWAEAAIAQDRSPFRKVEVFPSLLTERGALAPPLVFWINRASCMAGGVVLLPPQQAEEGLEEGRACARALGLRHFVTWAPREIVFWEERGEATLRTRTVPLPAAGHSAAGFREALGTLMEELKVLSVLGAVPPNLLSEHYLANLCLGTVQQAAPALSEAWRVARGEDRVAGSGLSAEAAAHRKGLMTLLRLLALVAHDRLPATVQPEGLERAMRFALDPLPPGPREALAMAADELELPAEGTVAFHHLFRRLVQLRLAGDRERTTRLLETLLGHEAGALGGAPLPSPPPADSGTTLLLNPDRAYPVPAGCVEVGAPPLLAFTALLRDLQGQPPLRRQVETPFLLDPGTPLTAVRGTLHGDDVPDAAERQGLTAQLRTSWPTRRFPLSPRTPRWAWQLLHLLGLAEAQAGIELDLPDDWLIADYGAPLAELLREQFTLEDLAAAGAGRLHIRLCKGAHPEGLATVTGAAGTRQFPWSRLGGGHRSLLALALHLPDDLFALVEEGFLHLPDEESWPAGNDREVYLFSRSTLGRRLWETVSGGRPLPQRKHLREEALRRGWPLPAAEILENLRLLAWREGDELPPQSALDGELALWLGSDLDLSAPPREAVRRRAPARPTPAAETGGELAAELAQAVFVDGLPRFPEHYLYDHYRPQLVEYAFAGPLAAEDEFFGRFTLRDREGRAIEVEGEETARALLLASHGEASPVALPADRHLTAAILERYLRDLKVLRRTLLQKAHGRLADLRAADALADEVWRSSPLPPWELVEG